MKLSLTQNTMQCNAMHTVDPKNVTRMTTDLWLGGGAWRQPAGGDNTAAYRGRQADGKVCPMLMRMLTTMTTTRMLTRQSGSQETRARLKESRRRWEHRLRWSDYLDDNNYDCDNDDNDDSPYVLKWAWCHMLKSKLKICNSQGDPCWRKVTGSERFWCQWHGEAGHWNQTAPWDKPVLWEEYVRSRR